MSNHGNPYRHHIASHFYTNCIAPSLRPATPHYPGAWSYLLQFDPEYSPPSTLLSETRQDLYYGYNLPAMSRFRRAMHLRVVDSLGLTVTTGPAASMQVKVDLTLPINDNMALTSSESYWFPYISSISPMYSPVNLLQAMYDGDPNQVASYYLGTVRRHMFVCVFAPLVSSKNI